MPDTPIKDLLPAILVQLPECPSAVVLSSLRRAVRDFFKETFVWKQELLAVPVAVGDEVAAIAPLANTEILAIDHVWFDGKVTDNTFGVNDAMTEIMFDKPSTIAADLRVKACLAPLDEIPAHYVRQYGEVWEAGALQRLQRQTGTLWYSPQDSMQNREIYRLGVAEARRIAATGGVTGDMRVTPRPFI